MDNSIANGVSESSLNFVITGTGHQNFCDVYLLASPLFLRIAAAIGGSNPYNVASDLDEFIVAYFKGDRITIAAAKDLLSQYGDSILFSNPTQEVFHSEELAYQSSDKKYFSQDEVKAVPIYHRYQSNDEFESFPLEKLAYFNQFGLFQYNPDTKKIESLSFKIENDLENTLKLSGYLSSLTYNPTYFTSDIIDPISGDLADFILRSQSIQQINSTQNLQIEFEKSVILKANYTNMLKDTFQLNIKPHE
jgi:hypothetical protein